MPAPVESHEMREYHVPELRQGRYAGFQSKESGGEVTPSQFLAGLGINQEIRADYRSAVLAEATFWLNRSHEFGLTTEMLALFEKAAGRLQLHAKNLEAAKTAKYAFGEVEGQGEAALPLWVVYHGLLHNVEEAGARLEEQADTIYEVVMELSRQIEDKITDVREQIKISLAKKELKIQAAGKVSENQRLTYTTIYEAGQAVQKNHQAAIVSEDWRGQALQSELRELELLQCQLQSALWASMSYLN